MSDWLPNAHPTLQEPQQQSRQSGGELMHEDAMDLFPSQQQAHGLWNAHVEHTDRLTMMQASTQSFMEQSVPQQSPLGLNAGAIPSGTPQQQVAGSDTASHIGQSLNPSGTGLPQGPGSPQQNITQPSASNPHTNSQPSSTTSASQIPQPIPDPPLTIVDVPLPQLRALSIQLLQIVTEGEKYLQANSSSGESEILRQVRAKVEQSKHRVRVLTGVMNTKIWASHYPTQQQDYGPWLSSLMQMPPHVSANGLLSNTVLAQMNRFPPQPFFRITHPPSQPNIQLTILPYLSEDRFHSNFMEFTRLKGIRLSERDLVVDDRRINLLELHQTVFSRDGFDLVSARREWPSIGAALGFPLVSRGPGQSPRCSRVVAQRLQKLYNDILRPFDQIYISSVVARLWNMQASGPLPPRPPQPQGLPYQPVETDYQALLAITSMAYVINTEMKNVLSRFSHTSNAELDGRRVPPHIIALVDQNRVPLQRLAQDQNEFHAGPTPTENAPLYDEPLGDSEPPEPIPDEEGRTPLIWSWDGV